MRNKEVIDRFLQGLPAWGSNLYSTGDKLVNYNTTIAEWDSGRLYINNTKYSKTTSTHQNYMIFRTENSDWASLNKTDIPIGTTSLVTNKSIYF